VSAKQNNGTGGAAGAANNTTAVNSDALLGTWGLDVKTPFGQHPATLTLARGAGGEVVGSIKSQLGDGELSRINVESENLSAVVTLALQGRTFDAQVSARVEGAQMTGTIKVSNLPIPAPALKFTGKKNQ
jgi:hypothetical protein